MTAQLHERTDFSVLRYANCWEDADILMTACRPAKTDRVLSIASAGDNSFAYLAFGVERVDAVDLSQTQLNICCLKKEAIRQLDYETCLAFLGYRLAIFDRWTLFSQSIAPHLDPSLLLWCRAVKEEISSGIIHHGKLERYFKLFKQKVLPWIHKDTTVLNLFETKNENRQVLFFQNSWNSWRWRLLFKVFFSKTVMGKIGRDPEFLKQVNISVPDFLLDKAAGELSSPKCQENPFLHFIFTGEFGAVLPFYLRAENFDKIKSNLDRIFFHQGYIQEVAQRLNGRYDIFNLSNIFEYLPENVFESLVDELADCAKPSARMAYWNLMVDRRMNVFRPNYFESDEMKNQSWTKQDAGFFYKGFFLDHFILNK